MATGRQGRARGVFLARVRRWLLGGVVLLLLVLAGLLGYARYRARRLLADLPHRLGVDIKSETNGFTYSQSVKGRTVFTIHAAKAIQRENGRTTLHDVAITLYGPQGSNRTDSIRGAEFDYDQPNGLIEADGEVHLDLAAPAQAGAPVRADAKRIAVTTSGLIYLQKLGVAATDKPIHIVYGDIVSDAVGADFENDTGMLRLRHDVRMDGKQKGKAIHVDAAAAQLDRNSQLASFSQAHLLQGTDRAAGDEVKLALAKGGGIDSVEAEGHASVEAANGLHAEAPRLHAKVGSTGKLETATMSGGVQLHTVDSTGSAQEAMLYFSAAGVPTYAELQHAVDLKQAEAPDGSSSMLSADHVTAQLLQNATNHTVLHEAVATGNATLRSTSPPAKTITAFVSGRSSTQGKVPVSTTVVTAATLHAYTSEGNGLRYISSLDGTGARIEQSDGTGNLRTSTGDQLHATLRSPTDRKSRAGAGGTLQTVLQTGHVVIDEHKPAGAEPGAKAQDSHATAEHAEFDEATQQLVLTGLPSVKGPGVQLAATRLVLTQGGGDTEAEGNVRGTLVQQGANGNEDPIHVLADHATIPAAAPIRLYGAAQSARLWNSSAQLDAPAIDLDRAKGTLQAHADAKQEVHLLMAASTARPGSAAPSGPIRITGQELRMTSQAPSSPGKVEMSHSVRLFASTGEVTADNVLAILRKSSPNVETASAGKASLLNTGAVEILTANGNVHLQQPGRIGSGDRLVYTAATDRYELTGTASSPPNVTDSLRGSVSGTSLIFYGTGDSVEIAGAPGRRVHTETQASSSIRKH